MKGKMEVREQRGRDRRGPSHSRGLPLMGGRGDFKYLKSTALGCLLEPFNK